MELFTKQVSPELLVKGELLVGVVHLTATLAMEGIKGDLKVELDSEPAIDKIAKIIPGVIDDAILGLLKSTLKQLK